MTDQTSKAPDEFDFGSVVTGLHAGFNSNRTRPLQWRREQLKALERMLQDCEAEILAALEADLGKPALEGWMSEVSYVQSELDYTQKHLNSWMQPRRVPTPTFGLPGRSWIQPEPLGVVLIMSAWNYPFQLIFAGLVAAIAAGNCALLKPSELAAATAALVARRVPEYLDPECFAVVEGGVAETTALLRERFDHILYTGGAAVGKIVMTAAARHLTPVTLELGGKSPCVVLPDAKLETAARRIAWGRFMNAGQTCVAPDYVLTDPATRERLLPLLAREVEQMFGANPQTSDSYGRIINERHFDRLVALLGSGTAVTGGQPDRAERYIPPTVLTDVSADSPVMNEEIFGPVLPVLAVDDLDAAIAFIRAREKPLAAYLFSSSRAAREQFIDTVSAGNVCINDVMMFMVVQGLPFGGVGNSGMGAYKGVHGFNRFSHMKAVMKRGWWPDIALRYAPYTAGKFKWLKRLS